MVWFVLLYTSNCCLFYRGDSPLVCPRLRREQRHLRHARRGAGEHPGHSCTNNDNNKTTTNNTDNMNINIEYYY